MKSRYRVLTVLNHKEADRVPIDFGGMASTGIMAIAYNRLKKYLGINNSTTRMWDTNQQLGDPQKEILDRFHVDVINLNSNLYPFDNNWKSWTLPDGSPVEIPAGFNPEPDGEGGFIVKDDTGRTVSRMPAGVLYFEGTYHALGGAATVKDIEAYEFPVLSDEYLEDLRRRAKWLYENTDYAIMASFGGNILETGQGLRGWDQFMVDLAIEPEMAEALMDKMVEAHIKNLEKFLSEVGEYIQIIQMGDDLGTQAAPQLSPQLYRKMISPRHKTVYQYIKKNSNVKVFLHSCGSIYDLIPYIIDEGVDVLNPVQTSAAKMEPATLKKEFGRDIAFWGGGCDTQTVLPNATPKEIDAHVKQRMEIFAPGGGFVFNHVHNVQSNVPPENIIAMFDAAYKYGKY